MKPIAFVAFPLPSDRKVPSENQIDDLEAEGLCDQFSSFAFAWDSEKLVFTRS